MRSRGLKVLYASVLFLACHVMGVAQEIKVSGGFLKDSVGIGEPVGYYLTATYPKSLTVLFPDSLFSFVPFEFAQKKFFPTATMNGISYDSVVYQVRTFEIDKIQTLGLPVFVSSARDCTAFAAEADSIRLIELVKNPPDSVSAQKLPLKTNTLYERVFTEFNYVILLIVIITLLGAAAIGWVVFGKRIKKYFRLRQLTRSHISFLQSFSNQFQQINTLFSPEKTEALISIWKKYLEQLEKRPYTKLTTRETVQMIPDQKLGNSLHLIDRAIYGHQTSVNEPLEQLKKFAEERFSKKLEEIKNG